MSAGTANSKAVGDTVDAAVEPAWKNLSVDTTWDKLSPVLAEYGVRVAGALVFLVISIYLAGVASRAARRAMEKAHVEVTLARFVSNIARGLVLVLAVITCMSIVGIPVTSFAALIGAAGLAAGLALQGSLSNIAAGAALSITRPFKVGDMVVVAGQSGIVDEIALFTTALNTPDNRRIIIPNGQIFGAIIENMTHNPVRRVEVDVGVSYKADVDHTRAVLEAAARSVPGAAAEPASLVLAMGFGDSSVNWKVCVWAPKDQFLPIRQASIRAVKMALDEAGIEIPFPQRVLHLRKTDEAEL